MPMRGVQNLEGVALPGTGTVPLPLGDPSTQRSMNRVVASHTRGGSRMRESRTYGSVRGARDETRVPTATKARFHHLTRWRDDHLAARRTCAAAPNANDWLGRYEDAATDRSGS